MAKSNSIPELPFLGPSTEVQTLPPPISLARSAMLFVFFAALLTVLHAPLLKLPYFWDEAGYYVPAARDLLSGSLIPASTPSSAHPPLVLAWLALAWTLFGQYPLVTRSAMLLLAAVSLVGFYRLARTIAAPTVAAVSTVLVGIYPVFFAQSSLAQMDLPAAGLTFWGLEAYLRQRWASAAIWFCAAAMAKETAVLVPAALLLCQMLPSLRSQKATIPLASAFLPLILWYVYHYTRTGFVFGNPEFFRYNVVATLHPLRIVLAFFLRCWQIFAYQDLYVLTAACALAMWYPAREDTGTPLRRISLTVQWKFLVIAAVYVVALSVIGGAVLARYVLPIVPLFILICVSTVWRRLRPWKAVCAIVAGAFLAGLFVNPPYGFSPEDNLAYRDYILLHAQAEAFLDARYPGALVLTAWPASDELSRPYLGYVKRPFRVLKIQNFTAEQLALGEEARPQFDVALVFSTKYHPPKPLFDRWRLWREWKSRYFDYHMDLAPEAAAAALRGNLVYLQRRNGQWIAIVDAGRTENARLKN